MESGMWNFREDGGVNTVRPEIRGRSWKLAMGWGKMVKGKRDDREDDVEGVCWARDEDDGREGRRRAVAVGKNGFG